MLEVGNLHLSNPVAVVASYRHPGSNGHAGLVLLEEIDLDRMAIDELEPLLKMEVGSAMGLSVSCSQEGLLLQAASLASKHGCLLELRLVDMGQERILELIPQIKGCGTALALRLRPEELSDTFFGRLRAAGLDLIHIDLQGQDGMAQKIVKGAADRRGPKIMALGHVDDFKDARSLLAMGADIVSLRNADPEFVEWLSRAMEEYQDLSGWYNAPKHICAGGDLRGLAFCCPPVKHCPVLGALKKLGMAPEEFVERKLELARGTMLERGEGTCFGSLVWCCKISKPCYLRDAVLERIGLSGREYMALKKKLAEDLLRR
jgi:putative methanogenesis marker domain 9